MTISSNIENEIKILHFGEHMPMGTIASQLEIHRDVVQRVIGLWGAASTSASNKGKRLIDPYRDFIGETLKTYPSLRATRLYDMLSTRGYSGSIRTLREYVHEVRPRKAHEAFLRLSHLPGEQGQVDWAHVGQYPVLGGHRALWLFVMTLPHSRAFWGEFVFDLTAWSLIRSLTRACAYFEGTPREWLFDNAKSVVIERAGNAARFHPLLLELSGKYAARLKLCGIRKANEKGNVERTIRYLRDRFLAARTIRDIDQGNRDLLAFIRDTALARPHPTHPGQTVGECFASERTRLLRLPEHPVCTDQVIAASVDKTASVRFDKNIYSVPSKYCRQTITIAADDRELRILDGPQQIASHRRCWGRLQRIELSEHRADILDQKREASSAKGQDRLRAICPNIAILFERWVDASRNVGSQTSKVLRILDRYGDDAFRIAVSEVIEHGRHDPGAIAAVCERLRAAAAAPPAVDATFSDHVADRDVLPHDLGGYDV